MWDIKSCSKNSLALSTNIRIIWTMWDIKAHQKGGKCRADAYYLNHVGYKENTQQDCVLLKVGIIWTMWDIKRLDAFHFWLAIWCIIWTMWDIKATAAASFNSSLARIIWTMWDIKVKLGLAVPMRRCVYYLNHVGYKVLKIWHFLPPLF